MAKRQERKKRRHEKRVERNGGLCLRRTGLQDPKRRMRYSRQQLDDAVNFCIRERAAGRKCSGQQAATWVNERDSVGGVCQCRVTRHVVNAHVLARARNQQIGKPGRRWGTAVKKCGIAKGACIIPKEIVEKWVAYLGMSAKKESCVYEPAAISVLITMCDDVGVHVPFKWRSLKLPHSFWQCMADPEVYNFPDIRQWMVKNLDTVRRMGENPKRIQAWFLRTAADGRKSLCELQQDFPPDTRYSWEDLTAPSSGRTVHMDEKGMMQAAGTDGQLALVPSWGMRPHARTSGSRNWFTVVVFLSNEGTAFPLGVILEGGEATADDREACPGFWITCNKTGMTNTALHYDICLKVIDAHFKDGITLLLYDNAAPHIQHAVAQDMVNRDYNSTTGEVLEPGHGLRPDEYTYKRVVHGSFCSHSTRVLMANDNGWNARFSNGMNMQGGFHVLRNDRLPRKDLLKMIYQSWIIANDATMLCKLSGARIPAAVEEFRFTGSCPFGSDPVLRRLGGQARTLTERRKEYQAAADSYKVAQELSELLVKTLIKTDIALCKQYAPAFDHKAVVEDEDGVLTIDALQFKKFLEYQEKLDAKRKREGVRSEGHMFSLPEYQNKLADQVEEKRLREEGLQSRKASREEAIRHRQEAEAERRVNGKRQWAEEEPVRRLLLKTKY